MEELVSVKCTTWNCPGFVQWHARGRQSELGFLDGDSLCAAAVAKPSVEQIAKYAITLNESIDFIPDRLDHTGEFQSGNNGKSHLNRNCPAFSELDICGVDPRSGYFH